MLNVTPITLLLFVQAALLGISQLDSLSDQASQIIIVALVVVNAAVGAFIQTQAGKTFAARRLIKK